MKRLVFFSISFLFCLQLQAQWSVFHSGKYHNLNLSTANKQVAIYRGVACEVQLDSKKNKELKLTSSNATIKQNSAGSYTITTNEGAAIVQIYSVKKSKMKLLAEVSIPAVEIPVMTDLNLYGNEIQVGYNMSDFVNENYDMSLYDELVIKNPNDVFEWIVDFGEKADFFQPLKTFYGSGNILSDEVMNYLRFAPEGTEYRVTASYTGFNTDPYGNQPWPSRIFTIGAQQLPAAKYVILNNTPQNKAWFDEKDQSSLIGMLNNNYWRYKDELAGFFTESKSYNNGGFLRSDLISGIDPQGFPNKLNEKILLDNEISWDLKSIYSIGVLEEKWNGFNPVTFDPLPVYHLKGVLSAEPKIGIEGEVDVYDPLTETMDSTQAEKYPNTILAANVVYRIRKNELFYSTKNIEQIIIRYDSVLNISNGSLEIQPTRISLAKRLGKSDTLDIVFSIKYKDLMHFDNNGENLFAPTLHVTKEKNPVLFDLNNPESPVFQLNKRKDLLRNENFPFINRGSNLGFFEELVQENGKTDSTFWETRRYAFEAIEKWNGMDAEGYPLPVYHLKGVSSTKAKRGIEGIVDVFDPSTETTNPLEAEIDPETGAPLIVTYVPEEISRSQFKGLTDLFILQNYQFDPVLKTHVSKPAYLGFGQRMPGQEKPTLIMQVSLSEFPVLDSKLINATTILYLNQPWAQSLIQNNFSSSEVIDAKNINLLQKKFHFKRIISDISTMETEMINEPHF